jgi:hypothetical protein
MYHLKFLILSTRNDDGCDKTVEGIRNKYFDIAAVTMFLKA